MDWACVRGMIVRSHAFRRLVAVLCLIGATPALAQTTTLSLSLPISIDSPIGQNIGEFGREVEARTRGALKIEFQGKDRAYEENEVVSAVASGAIQIGATPLNQFAYDVPLAGAFLQPFLFNFDALVQAATTQQSEIRRLIEEEILLDQCACAVVAALRVERHLLQKHSCDQPDRDCRSLSGRSGRSNQGIHEDLRGQAVSHPPIRSIR